MDNATVKRFNFDRWEEVKVSQLRPGDEIASKEHGVVVVNALPSKVDSHISIPAIPKESSPIIVRLDEGENFPATCAVEEYTCIGRMNYPDGTLQFRDDELSPGCVYSPRLTPDELEAFCAEHLQRYEAWFNENESAIDSGYPPALSPWW